MDVVEVTYDKYKAYKDSGVDWLGKIPLGWEARRVKSIFRLVVEPAPKDNKEELLSVYTDIGVKPRKELEERGNKASTTDGYWKVKKGDVIVNKLLAWMGAIGVSDYDGVTSPAYDILRAYKPISGSYFHNLFRLPTCFSELKRHSRGIMDMRLRLYFDKFGDVIVPYPPIDVQTAITNFLDNKTTKIDQAITNKEKLIERLKERKQILIKNAVTGKVVWSEKEQKFVPLALSEVKSKDSGVEWIGEIPKGWEVKALKHLSYLESGETISSESFIEEGYPVYGGNGFRGYASNYTNEGEFALIGRQGALCGNVNFASGKFFASEHAIVVYHKKGINVLWLGETIKVADFNRLSQSAAQPGIAVNVVKNVLFPYPSIEEQNKIATYIETQSSKIDRAIALQQTQIEKLKEYKATLIDSAVTGKIKVG
jgi:type I restriction enzyme S subunit